MYRPKLARQVRGRASSSAVEGFSGYRSGRARDHPGKAMKVQVCFQVPSQRLALQPARPQRHGQDGGGSHRGSWHELDSASTRDGDLQRPWPS